MVEERHFDIYNIFKKEVDEMIFRKKKKTTESPSPIDTIVVIGNGFDRWQGLNTSYADFQTYYHEHLDEILKKLHIKKHRYVCPDGTAEVSILRTI